MKSSNIPDQLNARFALLQDLDRAYALLDNLSRSGTPAAAEKAFLSKRIDEIEQDLLQTESTVGSIIEQFKDDPIVWTALQFRYMQGYSWSAIADIIGKSADAIKANVYRSFSKQKS